MRCVLSSKPTSLTFKVYNFKCETDRVPTSTEGQIGAIQKGAVKGMFYFKQLFASLIEYQSSSASWQNLPFPSYLHLDAKHRDSGAEGGLINIGRQLFGRQAAGCRFHACEPFPNPQVQFKVANNAQRKGPCWHL